MLDHRPSPFGSLLSVVPIQQSQKRGPWRLTLVSLERWDTCWAVNLDIERDPLEPGEDFCAPFVEIDVSGAGGERYVSGLGGGYGGGRRDGGHEHRQLVVFGPAIDPASEPIRLEARLRLHRTAGSGATVLGDSPTWEDPEPWVFVVPPTAPATRVPANHPPSTNPDDPTAPHPPYELGDLLAVIPVVAERTVSEWTVTIVSAEVRTHGVRLLYRLLGPDLASQSGSMSFPHLRFVDEHDQEIPSVAGGSNGILDPRGDHVRGEYLAAVPPGTRTLRVRVGDIRHDTVEPDPNHPGMARLVVAERFPFGWDITVPLG